MSIRRTFREHALHCGSRQHTVTPRLDMRPTLDVHGEKSEHPWHGEWQIRKIGDGGSIGQGNVLLFGQRKLLVQDVPLLKTIGMKSEKTHCQLLRLLAPWREFQLTWQQSWAALPDSDDSDILWRNRASTCTLRYDVNATRVSKAFVGKGNDDGEKTPTDPKPAVWYAVQDRIAAFSHALRPLHVPFRSKRSARYWRHAVLSNTNRSFFVTGSWSFKAGTYRSG